MANLKNIYKIHNCNGTLSADKIFNDGYEGALLKKESFKSGKSEVFHKKASKKLSENSKDYTRGGGYFS